MERKTGHWIKSTAVKIIVAKEKYQKSKVIGIKIDKDEISLLLTKCKGCSTTSVFLLIELLCTVCIDVIRTKCFKNKVFPTRIS